MLDITEIAPGLWVGAYPGKALPKTIHVVVSVAIEQPPEWYHEEITGFLWMPTPDAAFPGLEWLDSIVDYIITARNTDEVVLVHCLGGISRSVLVVAAYLIKTRGMSADAALAAIKTLRSKINPAPNYVRALHEYMDYLHADTLRR